MHHKDRKENKKKRKARFADSTETMGKVMAK
jgi:hypothetical protein